MHADQSAALCIQMQPPRIGWMSTWRFPHTTSLSSPYFTYLEESQDISGIWHDFIIHRAGRAKHPSQGWRMNEENEDWRPITKYYKSKCNTQSSNQQKLQYITNHIWHTYNLTMGTGNPVIVEITNHSNQWSKMGHCTSQLQSHMHILVGFSSPSKHCNINMHQASSSYHGCISASCNW